MGKRLYFIFFFVLSLLFCGVGEAQASNETFNREFYFTCIPNGNGTFRFSFPVFSRATWNHWLSTDDGVSYITIDYGQNTKDTLAYFYGKNYGDVKTGDTETMHIKVRKGTLIINDAKYSASNDWVKVKTDKAKEIEGGQETLFLTFDFVPDQNYIPEGKDVEFAMKIYESRFGWDFEHYYNLGKYTYNTLLRQPTLIDPYIDANANAEEQGQMTFAWSSLVDVYEYKVIIIENGVETTIPQSMATKATYGQFNLPQSNTTKQVMISAKMYADSENKVERWMNSNVVEMKPYHGLDSLSCKNDTASHTVSGISVIDWSVDYPSSNDYMSLDAYRVCRSYSPNFSDSTVLGSVYINSPNHKDVETVLSTKTAKDGSVITDTTYRVKKAYFSFVDSTFGAAFNPYNLNPSKDSVLIFAALDPVNYSASKTADMINYATTYRAYNELLPYYRMLMVPKRVVYYSVERASAASLWDKPSSKFRLVDSVYKTLQLPLITSAEVVKNADWDDSKSVTLNVRLDNYHIWDLQEYKKLTSNKPSHKTLNSLYPSRLYTWDTNANIRIVRHNRETGDSSIITISGSDVKMAEDSSYFYASVVDGIDDAFSHYYYTAIVDTSESYLPINPKGYVPFNMTIDKDSLYYSATASINTFDAISDCNGITLKWSRNAGPFSAYRLERRISSTNNFIPVELEDSTANVFVDKTVNIGESCAYRLSIVYYHNGNAMLSSSKRTSGRRSNLGIVTGKVETTSGIGVANVTVIAENTVTHDSVKTVTSDDGSYRLECPAVTGGTQYNIFVSSQKSAFQPTTGTAGFYQVGLSEERMVYENTNFACSNSWKFVGRVLFANTTVPVKDAHFKVNGHYVFDSNNNLLSTDSYGNFSFDIPEQEVKIQVVKEGHKFTNNGYLYELGGKESDTVFTPTSDYKGLEIFDSTKVRLAGRIAAGTKQAELPLGFGLSKNYIGDSLTIVMQLEGDDTSLLIFNKKKSNLTRVDTVIAHPADPQHSTMVITERKRLTIKPDSATGEFYADLLPVKYKVVQLYAQGYSTLFGAGEAAQILDLSADSLIYAKDYTYEADQRNTLHASYNQSYIREYHAPVEVTYKQYNYGQLTSLLGETKTTEANMVGENKEYVVATEDAATGKITYSFGHPVYEEGNTYTIYAYANEAYYYNGKQINKDNGTVNVGETNRVYYAVVPNGTLTICNGLTDDNSPKTIKMDENGVASFSFTANNPTFNLTEEDALRYLNFSVEADGYHYDANPQLAAFVTGTRDKGTDVYTKTDADINLIDILRDPPGSNSYAYIEKGTKYVYNRTLSFSLTTGLSFNFKYGTNYTAVIGTVMSAPGSFCGTLSKGSNSFETSFEIPAYQYKYWRSATYEFDVNNRIETSSDPHDVGASADVYIGTTDNVTVGKADVVSFIDYETYKAVQPAIAKGAVKVLAKSADAKGDSASSYLVVGEKIHYKVSYPTQFMYTQRHILESVIPDLIRRRDSLIMMISKEKADSLAKAIQQPVYYSKVPVTDKNFGVDSTAYGVSYPGNGNDYDEVEHLNALVLKWMGLICANEKVKVAAINTKANSQNSGSNNQFSVSGGFPVAHDESDLIYDSECPNLNNWTSAYAASYWTKDFGIKNASNLVNSLFSTISANKILTKEVSHDNKSAQNSLLNKMLALAVNSGNIFDEKNYDDNDVIKPTSSDIETPQSKFSVELSPIFNPQYNNDYSIKKSTTRTTGFVLQTSYDSHIDVAVLFIPCDSSLMESSALASIDFASMGTQSKGSLYLHDYVFYLKGGATRTLYEEPDSTFFWYTGTPLGATSLKIENPQIEISQPVVSNIPQDEKAVFTLKLINASESASAIEAGYKSTFYLKLDDSTNSSGAKVFMDGTAITEGRSFIIPCGSYITKTIEVMRGTGFDINKLGLVLSTDKEEYDLKDEAYITVNYMPDASPVSVVSPVNKWVLNTLAQHDSAGYYLPIEVNGFNRNYDGFDHIEVQYKETNKGDDAWVNLCSYYANDSLFNKASGNKEMLPAGSIKLKFHGGKDPMEMKYDIRAVSFSRYGNSFVPRYSDVMSGTKDTRCPSVFGLPEPTNGILSFGDVIKLPFTEPIAYNYLDKTANFEILGYKNTTSVSEGSALTFAGNKLQKAASEASRNLVNHSFTVDMMVSANESGKNMTFLSHGDELQNFTFGINSQNKLTASINGETFTSDDVVNLKGSLTRVGLLVDEETKTVSFFAGNEVMSCDGIDTLKEAYKGDGPIYLGTDINHEGENLFAGRLLEVRIWANALSDEELNAYNHTLLNGHESQLVAHYPLSETQGHVAHDEVNGANLVLANTTWATKFGHSLRTGVKPVTLDAAYLQKNVESDYTMMFWFKSADKLDDNNDTLAIFTAGGANVPDSGYNKLFIGYEATNLVVRANGVSNSLGKTYTDGEWHHFAMTVNRTQNAANFYIDGNLTSQLSGSAVGGIASDYAAFGNTKKSFNIDLFSLWNLALPSNYIGNHYNDIPNETDTDLSVYLPFEQYEDAMGLASPKFSTYNEKRDYDTNVDIYADKKVILTNATEEANDDDATWAPVVAKARLSKLDFDWSSTDQTLLINLLEKGRDINNQELYITVRNVEDLNGNVMKNPTMWALYASLNQLYFDEKSIRVTADYGEEGSFNLNMINKSGSERLYSISNSTDWLEPEVTKGSSSPESEEMVSFAIHGTNDPGSYFDIINLEDENGLVSSCVVNLVVKGGKPNFTIDKNKFDYTMVYKGQVMLKTATDNEIIDNRTSDTVYAFTNGNCVGKGGIQVNDNGSAYTYMMIYGTSTDAQTKSEVTFKLWNDATGKLLDMKSSSAPVAFVRDGEVGIAKTDTLRESQNKIRELRLNEGWNWISVSVKPASGTNSVSKLFNSSTPFAGGDLFKSPTRYDEFSNKYQTWTGNISTIGNDTVYLVKVDKAGIYNIVGADLDDDDMTLTIKGGQWSPLPYLLDATTPINTALADLEVGVNAKVGDVVKGLNSFAFLSDNNTWEGDLQYLRAGEGYFIHLQDDGDRTVTYHKNSFRSKAFKPAPANTEVGDSPSPVVRHANNMPVIAMFATNVSYQKEDKLVAYANGVKAGEALLKSYDGNDVYLLSVNAEQGDAITFAQERDGETIAQTKAAVKYNANSILGSAQNPYTIDFNSDFVKASPTLFTDEVNFNFAANTTEKGSVKVYNTDGLLVWEAVLDVAAQNSIQMNGESLPAGVYHAVVKLGGVDETISLIKK